MNDIMLKQLKCIGILGGTFNPVHKGHIMLAQEVLNQFQNIEKLYIMPNNIPAYKESEDIISSQHRINMLKLASEDIADAVVSDMEILRGGQTYTIDTLRQIKSINNDIKLYFIIGADSLYNIEKWREYEEIFKYCTIIAAKRDCDLDDIIEYSKELKTKYSSLNIEFLETQAIDISSSAIRHNLKNQILDDTFLDDKIIKYIKNNKLYGWNS